jgi:hypothetical protein
MTQNETDKREDALCERLAERCEAAPGPDRDIDGWIYARLMGADPYIVGSEPGRFPQKPIYGTRLDVMQSIGGKDGADYCGAPKFTASLDAAMTLVPEGWHWSVVSDDCAAVFKRTERKLYAALHDATAITPALALCAAALRARAAQEGPTP